MPIYEYSCADCQQTFEKMRPMSRADDAISCPDCGGVQTKRGLSLFAASVAAGWLWDTISPAAPFFVGAGLASLALLGFMILLRE